DEVLTMLDAAVAKASPKQERGNQGGGQPENPQEQAQNAAMLRAMVSVLQEDAVLVKALLPAARQKLQVPPPFSRPGRQRAEGLSGGLHDRTREWLAVMAARTHQLDDAERLYRNLLADPRVDRRAALGLYAGLLDVLWQGHKFEEIV